MTGNSYLDLPRLMIAGMSGDSGKTFLAIGLAAIWREDGLEVVPFKKGPDYIDPAWLGLASGRTSHNLDTWMMGREIVLRSFLKNGTAKGINLVEANRGLYDGEDSRGTHSSAELAKLLKIPVVLVIPALKITRTAAAIALGIKMLDPEVRVSGVVLNQIANSRQEKVIRDAIEGEAGLSVLGAIPRLKSDLLPSRHLGLVTPQENHQAMEAVRGAARIIRNSTDLKRLKALAKEASPLETLKIEETAKARKQGLRVGVFRSAAFTFYYPENIEAIERCGATVVPIDPLRDPELPKVDALYIGGGFPETHATSLAANAGFRESVREAICGGLRTWAECGGLIFLSQTLSWRGKSYPMAGALPIDITLGEFPAGHGYEEVIVDRPNPFMKVGTVLRGHEFHYSAVQAVDRSQTIFQVTRGVGLGKGRDGIVFRNTIASYLHLHALATQDWAHWLMGRP